MATLIASGCATKNRDFSEYFRPTQFVTRTLPFYEGNPHGELYMASGQNEVERFIKNQSKMGDDEDLFLGWLMYPGKELTPGKAREITAQCGGDKYIAVTAANTKDNVNMVWIRASPARQRELLNLNAINAAMPSALNNSPGAPLRNPVDRDNLLLHNSTL